MDKKICVVLVVFKPNKEQLLLTIDSLKRQVSLVIIIDNTPCVDNCDLFQDQSCFYVPLLQNLGIAQAQNIGIRIASERKYDFILFSDQDTIYPESYVNNMLGFFTGDDKTSNIVAVAPLFKDRNKKESNDGFIISGRFGFKRIYPTTGFYEVFQVISSGQIVHLSKFLKVGFFDEKLFIDWVDIEWCWRANAKGFKIIGCADVIISHCLGDNVKKVVGKNVNLRNVTRHYYITRNSVYLALNCRYISFSKRMILLSKSFGYIIGFTVLNHNHIENLVMTIKGFIHGFSGKLGCYH